MYQVYFLPPWYNCQEYVPGTAFVGYMCRMYIIVEDLDLGSDPLPGAEVLHTSAQETHRTWYPR